MRFSGLRLSPALIQVVEELGYESLTPVQERSIPLLLDGQDLVGQSKTGSGKTAAFALPILQKISLKSPPSIQALVLCPTRELCTQVAREIRKLGRRHAGLQVLILSGGQPMYPQLTALERGVHIVVGTPGRVLDHLNRERLNLQNVATLVLDEADRMLEMGFELDMEKILRALPKERQTVFFSATYPSSIEKMSRAYQRNPALVKIEEQSELEVSTIEQSFYEAKDPRGKLEVLKALLEQSPPESAIIFCNLKVTVAELASELERAGLSVAALHGDLEQSARDRVMAKFRNQSTRILVATDVAARGIDIENLDVVFNFDLPSQEEIYVHRIGRTGRAGKNGRSISLGIVNDGFKVRRIEKYTGKTLERKTLSLFTAPAAASQLKPLEAKMATLFISGGRKDKLRPGDILGALTGEAGGLLAAEIGKIEIHDRFSYVAVSKLIAKSALEKLSQGRIKGRKFRIEPVR